jgi:hypothetical protein
MGINLSEASYYSSQLVFVDVFKMSMPWVSQDVDGEEWDTAEPLELNAEGYPLLGPGKAAATLMCRGLQGHYPGGEYVCLYEGEGTLEFALDARSVSQSPGRIVLNVIPTNSGIYLRVTSTDLQNPVRDIRVLMRDFEDSYETQIFSPSFIELVAPFKTLRFMDWQRTNNSQISEWKDRSKPTDYTQCSKKGVALEYMIELANLLNIDPWFCMPHLATDDFVRQFATMVKDRLKPSLHVYLENSNEVWNGMFAQASFCEERGLAAGLSKNPFEAQLRYYSQRSVEIFAIWESVFGSSGRLVRVLGSQHANPWVSATIMDWNDAFQRANCLAVAPYFGGRFGLPSEAKVTVKMSVDQLLDACEADIVQKAEITRKQATEAAARGLELIAYEGGQHLVGVGGTENSVALTKLFHDANRDARMRSLYLKDLTAWKNSGGKLFVAYSSVGCYSKWGSWGLLEWPEQEARKAPKYEALLEFMAGQEHPQ